MTDLEMTRLCAESMGLRMVGPWRDRGGFCVRGDSALYDYDPLEDDTQAMALVKRHALQIDTAFHAGCWHVTHYRWFGREARSVAFAHDADLKRAIVECVANMQASKHGS